MVVGIKFVSTSCQANKHLNLRTISHAHYFLFISLRSQEIWLLFSKLTNINHLSAFVACFPDIFGGDIEM